MAAPLWPLTLTALCYLAFNAAMFSGLRKQAQLGAPRRGAAAAVFVVNYLCFIAFSMLQFNLITNWLLICVLFTCEIKAAFRCGWRKALFCALFVSIIGLGANVFSRSLCAIVMDLPQSAFSNDTLAAGNIKTIPVAAGFLLAALFMRIQGRRFCHGEMAVVYGNVRSRRFVLAMVALAYLYLCSILLLYYVDSNSLVVKVWALKVAVSAYVSVSLAFYYAHRTAALIDLSEHQRALEREVDELGRQGRELQGIAQVDELTGCCTRGWTEARIAGLLGADRQVALAFIDVNDLKTVNDEGGHGCGDAYLANVAAALDNVLVARDDVLGRWGGDEFVVALPEVSAPEAAARLEEAQHRLRTESFTERCPFALSISYGVAVSRPGDSVSALISRADKLMYRAKRAGKSKPRSSS